MALGSLNNFTDILFLHIASFADYRLNEFNIEFIAVYLLFYQIILYYFISTKNEEPSYLSFLAIRMNRKATIQYREKKRRKDFIILFLLFNIFLFGSFLIIKMITTHTIVPLDAVAILFTVRLLFIGYFISVLYDIFSMLDKGSYCYGISNGVFFFLFITDMLCKTNVVTYSGELQFEVICLTAMLIVFITVRAISMHWYFKQEDLL